MRARSFNEIERVWLRVDNVKNWSDRIVGIGPFGIGLDGLLTWLPIAGGTYTVIAGLFLLWNAMQAHASPGTLAKMLVYLLSDTAVSEVPLVGSAVDTLFQGHLFAAGALQKEIERTHWIEQSWRQARDSGEWEAHRSEARAQGKRRVVYLGG